jgi:predicted transcriptional regulator
MDNIRLCKLINKIITSFFIANRHCTVAIIGFSLFGLMTGCTTNKTTGPAPLPAIIVHFSKDTLFWNVLFTDTIHAKNLSASSSDGKGITIHLIDSKQGMSTMDSIFSWIPKDTGSVYVNATICGANGYCDTLRDTLLVRYASISKHRFHFKSDTIPRFVRFIDTLRADSGSIARFGTTGFSRYFIDSIKGMVLLDSIFQWTPQDTGPAEVAITQCIPNGPCDTLLGSLIVINGGALPTLSFRFRTDTLCLGELFLDTLSASRLAILKSIGKINSFHLIDAGKRAMQLTDSVFLWIPGDSGKSSVSIVVGDDAGSFYSIRDTFIIHQCSIDRYCPSYMHKDDLTFGRQSNLPAGFFVYAYEYDPAHLVPGIYISTIRNFSSSLIPSTENEVPRSIKISDDGKWILYANGYNNAYLISIDGSRKYQVPLSGAQVNMVDFYRNGPNGVEICYTTTDTVRYEIYAIQVKLDSVPTFGAIRTIADLTGSFRIEPYYPISVVKDQILGAFSLLWQGAYVLRMGFLTIPDGGRGLALPQDMFKWANETGKQVGDAIQRCLLTAHNAFIFQGLPGWAAPREIAFLPNTWGSS